MGSEIFHTLKTILAADGHITSVGDEGGFAPNLKNHDEAFSYILKAIEESGYNPGSEWCLPSTRQLPSSTRTAST